MPLTLVSAAPPTIVYFPPTGHNLGGTFLTYWRAHGALPTFGYPLMEEFIEESTAPRTPRPGTCRIEVNLSRQHLFAWQGGRGSLRQRH